MMEAQMMEAQGERAVIGARPAKADQRQKPLNRFGDGWLLLYAVMALCPVGLGDHHQSE